MSCCTIRGCSRNVRARNMCPMHYARWRKYGDASVTMWMRLSYGESHSSIAQVHGVSRKAISKIANHITWKETA